MTLYGGITIPGRPDLENIRRLDLMPMKSIAEMQQYGIAIDRDRLRDISGKLEHELYDLRLKVCDYVPPEKLDEFIARSNMDAEDDYLPMNVDSNKQLTELMFNVLGIGKDRQLKRTKSGDQISTSKRQLEQIKSEHPVVQNVLDYRERMKLKSTYADALPELAREHPAGTCWCGLKHHVKSWRIHTTVLTTRTATGRFASKWPNLQNLPIRSVHGRAIRACFEALAGFTFISVDFGQIELRMQAHLGRVSRMIQAFKDGVDIHMATAMAVFNEPDPDKIDKLTMRAPAKNCIAEGQRVLTDRGLVPIQDVSCCDKLWDGVEWVSHEGVISQGVRKVITYDGLTATPDHKVWCSDGRKIPFAEAVANGSRLAATGYSNYPVTFNPLPACAGDSKKERLSDSLDNVSQVQQSKTDFSREHIVREVESLFVYERKKIQGPKERPALKAVYVYSTTVFKSKVRVVAGLWRSWYQKQIQKLGRVRRLYTQELAPQGLHRSGYRSDQEQQTLPTWEPTTRNQSTKSKEYTKECVGPLSWSDGSRRTVTGSDEEGLPKLHVVEDQNVKVGMFRSTVARDTEASSTRKVYDILNAGPRRRFTVEGKLVSNCNFGIIYRETAHGLHEQLLSDTYGKSGIPVPEWLTEEWCQEFIDKWYGLYHEVLEYQQQQDNRAYRYGVVWDMFGRIRRVPEVKSVHKRVVESGLRQAGNMPIQGTAAELMKLAMCEVQVWIESTVRPAGIWCWPQMTIHDELLLETELEHAEVVAAGVVDIFERVLTDRQSGKDLCRVPIVADAKIGARWEK